MVLAGEGVEDGGGAPGGEAEVGGAHAVGVAFGVLDVDRAGDGGVEEKAEVGVDAGAFKVEDPTLLANTLYASGLGALQLARVGILVKEAAPGVPTVGSISPDQVRDYLVASALALASR